VFKIARLETGAHAIRAAYSGSAGKKGYHPSSSPNLVCTVGGEGGGRGHGLVHA
jgi:hypothetical protein